MLDITLKTTQQLPKVTPVNFLVLPKVQLATTTWLYQSYKQTWKI